MTMQPPGPADGDDPLPPIAEINITPLVDVMLVLLIIFMVAAPMMVAGLPVNLPRSEAPGLAQPQEPLVITLAADGMLHLGDAPLTPAALPAALAPIAAATPERLVLLRADRALAYGEVMRLLGQLARLGFQRVSLVSEAER